MGMGGNSNRGNCHPLVNTKTELRRSDSLLWHFSSSIGHQNTPIKESRQSSPLWFPPSHDGAVFWLAFFLSMGLTKSDDIRRVRAKLMLQDKVLGMSYKEIAAKWKLSLSTIERELYWGRQQGVLQDYEDQININLMPDVIKNLHAAVLNGDTHVALEIAKGMGVLKKQRSNEPPQEKDDEESLEYYMKVTKKGRSSNEVPPAIAAQSADNGSPEADVIDADVLALIEEGTKDAGEISREESIQAGEPAEE